LRDLVDKFIQKDSKSYIDINKFYLKLINYA